MTTAAIFLFVLILALDTAHSKQRSWLGPVQLIQGDPPIQRDSFGFTSLENRIYVYGGIGDIVGSHSMHFMRWILKHQLISFLKFWQQMIYCASNLQQTLGSTFTE